MILVNCTKKLLRRSRVEQKQDVSESTNALGAWCANVFNLGRYPYVLLTNETTLLSTVFLYREFKNITFVMTESLRRQLSELQIPEIRNAAEVEQCSVISFGSDTKRPVLGSMNDLVFQIKSVVEGDGRVDIVELERMMRRAPFSAIRSIFPEKAVKEAFGVK